MKPVLILSAVLALGCVFPTRAQQQSSAATAETRYVDVQGQRIAYRRIGSGSPIIASTRMRGTIDTWDPLFLDSLAKEHTVITFDYPGVGYSTGKLPPDIGQVAVFIDALAEALEVDRYAILGWSWGGIAAQALLIDQPQKVTHAILLGTAPPGPGLLPIQQAFLDRAFKPVNDLADEEVLFFEPTSDASRKAAKASRDRIHARPGVDRRIPSTAPEIQAYLQAAQAFREDGARREAIKRTRVPILVLSGDNDISTPAANWFPLSNELQTAQMLVLPDSGHGPQHQYPELSANYINVFLSSPRE